MSTGSGLFWLGLWIVTGVQLFFADFVGATGWFLGGVGIYVLNRLSHSARTDADLAQTRARTEQIQAETRATRSRP